MSGFYHLRFVIADVAEVAIKGHPSCREQAHHAYYFEGDAEGSLLVHRVGIDFVQYLESLVRTTVTFGTEEMGQEYQGKEGGSHHGKGSKPTEVLQQVTLGKEQAQESSNGSQASQNNGGRLVFQYLDRVADILGVSQHMEAITQGHAHHNGTDTHGHQGHATLEPIDASQGEEDAIDHRRKKHEECRTATETISQDDANDDQGQAYRQPQVATDLTGIEHAIHRRTIEIDFHFGVFCLEGIDFLFQHIDQQKAGHGVKGAEVGCQESEGYGRIGHKQVSIHQSEACCSLVHGHSLRNHRHAEGCRVLSHHGSLVSFLVVHHEVIIQSHLSVDGFFCQERIETFIRFGRHEGRDMHQGIIQSVNNQVIVYLMKDIGNVLGSRILFQKVVDQFIAIFRQCFRGD